MNELNMCVAKLGLPTPSSVEQITAGIGGSPLYRVTVGKRTIIIKYTRPSAPQIVRTRAEKEFRFYHELAPHLPINAPELLGSFHDEDGYALALRCYHSLTMRSTTFEQYLTIIDAIAQLHARYWGDRVPALAWLRHNPADVSPDDSLELWIELIAEYNLETEEILRERSCRKLFSQLSDIEKLISSYPITLCHGDFHAGNILLGEQGEIIIADWQEVTVGAGPGDLAFLLQRSSPTGLGLSDEAAIEHYVSRLNQLGVHTTASQVADVVNACKLRTMLLFWPSYLVGAPQEWVWRIASDMVAAGASLGCYPVSRNSTPSGR